ncbi:MAG: hypothetical protein WDW38_011376 [Sanguina aurantia]
MDIDSLRARHLPSSRHVFTHRDVILYALSVGCNIEEQLQLVYEDSKGFAPPSHLCCNRCPSCAVLRSTRQLDPKLCEGEFEHTCTASATKSACKAQAAKCLHGEQYVELLSSLPTSGTWVTTSKLLDIQDKGLGKGVVAVVRTLTSDDDTGVQLAVNEFTVFALGAGSGGSSGSSSSSSSSRSSPPIRAAAATAANTPPNRRPDAARTYQTYKDQAALYRLNGDYNPLHIDPRVSAAVGYSSPILHGMCTMGIAVRLVTEAMAGGDPRSVKSVKVRFSKHVFPGDQLRVDMWVGPAPDTVIFQAVLPGRDSAVVLSAAAVTFWPGKMQAPDAPMAREALPRGPASSHAPGGAPATASKL